HSRHGATQGRPGRWDDQVTGIVSCTPPSPARRQPRSPRIAAPVESRRPSTARVVAGATPDHTATSAGGAPPVTGNASRTRPVTPSRPADDLDSAAGGGTVSPTTPASSTTSAVRPTRTAPPSRNSMWHPTEATDVTGPGTAPTGRPSASAHAAVLSAPLR